MHYLMVSETSLARSLKEIMLCSTLIIYLRLVLVRTRGCRSVERDV